MKNLSTPDSAETYYKHLGTMKTGFLSKLPWIGFALMAITGTPASAQEVTPEQFIDRFEEINGVHPGFRRNHAKGVGVSGFFESNGNGVRLSSATVFKPGRVPVIGRFSVD